ncbi:G2/mitotic-specific cyclin-B-like [Bolinopsis microptera]|uniref:G2/mitotic-specific cyclin-B-like n=1 Tax=Bolinopsis microptera TaxID=2820187 RepID=UPI00307A5EA4
MADRLQTVFGECTTHQNTRHEMKGLVDRKPRTDLAKPRDISGIAKPRVTAKEETEAMDWEQTEPDIDDNDDPDVCGEYCKEIFKNESAIREHKWVMAARLQDIATLRVGCVDWLTEVCFTWKLATDTFFTAVLYLDKALRTLEYSLDDIQPLTGTCLFLAAKMEEVQAIPIDDIVEIAPGTSVAAIKSYEKKILVALNYEMVTPHLMLFVRRYNSISGTNMETHNISKYLSTLVVRYQGHCSGPQSMLAAAICFLARRIMGYSEAEAWSSKQTTYSGYLLEEIKMAVYFVSHALFNANRRAAEHSRNSDKVTTAYRVFNQRKFQYICTKPCLRQKFVETYGLLNVISLEKC